jgi:cytochrome P450
MTSETVPGLRTWPLPRSCPMLPPDAYRELREGPPVKVRLRRGDAWLITRYEDVRAALADLRLSSDERR